MAREGWPVILVSVAATVGSVRLGWEIAAFAFGALTVAAILLFRDPPRAVPAQPLAVVAPVDGRVVLIEPTDRGPLEGEALRITLRINPAGAYSVRSPTEGKVLNLRDNVRAGSRLTGRNGLWVRTDEDDDVLLIMRGFSRLAMPAAFVGYGERLGQGQRFAFIRLATHADVYVDLASRVAVKPGERVLSGSSVLAYLVHQ